MSDTTDEPDGTPTLSTSAAARAGRKSAGPPPEAETSNAADTAPGAARNPGEEDVAAPADTDPGTDEAGTDEARTGDARRAAAGSAGDDVQVASDPAPQEVAESGADGPDEPGPDGPDRPRPDEPGPDEPAGDASAAEKAPDGGPVADDGSGGGTSGGGTSGGGTSGAETGGGVAQDGAEPAAAQDAGAPGQRSALLSARFWGASPAGLLIGVLFALLGFGLVIQLQSNTGSGLASRRQDDLVRILDDLSSREERLRQQITGLEQTRDRLSTGGDNSQAALEEAHRRAAELGILAGTLPAAGPGIQITITDLHHRVTAEDMLDAIEELRGAGAEAIEVRPARIGLSSAFTQDTTTGPIMVEGMPLTLPYVIVAIGDPPTLATAMTFPGGVVDTIRSRDGDSEIVQLRRLVIQSLRQVRTPQYAQPSPTTSN